MAKQHFLTQPHMQVIEADIGSTQLIDAVDRARRLLQLSAAEGAALAEVASMMFEAVPECTGQPCTLHMLCSYYLACAGMPGWDELCSVWQVFDSLTNISFTHSISHSRTAYLTHVQHISLTYSISDSLQFQYTPPYLPML